MSYSKISYLSIRSDHIINYDRERKTRAENRGVDRP
jgi:hypothetical protein